MMNVLIITHDRYLNGASKSMLNLIDQLSDRVNFEVCLPFDNGPVFEELNKRNVKVWYCPLKRWMRKKRNRLKWFLYKIKWICWDQFYNILLSKKLAKELASHDIDLIHSNVSVVNFGALLSKRMNKPHVWYFREFGKEDFSKYPLCSKRYFYRTVNNSADAVIFVSHALQEKYKAYLYKPKQYVIYNGVGEENVIKDKIYTDENGCCKFLITGSLSNAKRQDIAISAVDELIKRGYTQFKLLIAGRGDNTWLTEMKCFHSEYVHFLGQVDDMTAVRRYADIELMCSRCEAFGRVTVEAMLAGMPVIGSDSGGTSELIRGGETGFLFEPGNYIDLADKMQYFLDNRQKVREMGMTAQSYAEKHLLISQCADEVYKTYKDALKNFIGKK